jgi:hypothetical protein
MLATKLIALAAVSFPAALSQLTVTQPTAQHWCTFPFQRVALGVSNYLHHALYFNSS